MTVSIRVLEIVRIYIQRIRGLDKIHQMIRHFNGIRRKLRDLNDIHHRITGLDMIHQMIRDILKEFGPDVKALDSIQRKTQALKASMRESKTVTWSVCRSETSARSGSEVHRRDRTHGPETLTGSIGVWEVLTGSRSDDRKPWQNLQKDLSKDPDPGDQRSWQGSEKDEICCWDPSEDQVPLQNPQNIRDTERIQIRGSETSTASK